MSIQKKSLISTLKTTKKANVAKENLSHAGSLTSSVKSAASTRSAAKSATVKVLAKRTLASAKLDKM